MKAQNKAKKGRAPQSGNRRNGSGRSTSRPPRHTGLTLLPSATTGVNTATSLQILAAALRPTAPHLVALLLRIAQQINDGYTSAQAVTNYTAVPKPGSVAELASAESTVANSPLAEPALREVTF